MAQHSRNDGPLALLAAIGRRQLELREEARGDGIELGDTLPSWPLFPPEGDTARYRAWLERKQREPPIR